MKSDMVLHGGCLCGGVRYQADIPERHVADYCHCLQCRKAAGAPVVAWVQVPPAAFRLTAGEARPFASSAHATRWFCPDCGSQLYMTDDAGRSVGITTATLDLPETVPPTVHGWMAEQLAWLDLRDDLPRYPAAPPYET